METQGPYFSISCAATYCGYAIGTFERYIREYKLPKCGPQRNRLAQSVLDAWMTSPDTFKEDQKQVLRKRTPKIVTIQKQR